MWGVGAAEPRRAGSGGAAPRHRDAFVRVIILTLTLCWWSCLLSGRQRHHSWSAQETLWKLPAEGGAGSAPLRCLEVPVSRWAEDTQRGTSIGPMIRTRLSPLMGRPFHPHRSLTGKVERSRRVQLHHQHKQQRSGQVIPHA